ncbi:hypothetical protein CQW23_30843 [Capsicum baccatum]|uniref:FF domain-containing protein n=1 Tax=Capsicum baccatum TaxID=33114 RepID=A0A2G2V982_CAPBA|nr:hypothetical protein CQW23_30843 [Capsicum baccatum]
MKNMLQIPMRFAFVLDAVRKMKNVKKDVAITEIGGATPSDEKTVKLEPLAYESKVEGKSSSKTLLESANIGLYCTLDQDCKELSPLSRWSKTISIFEHDERFKAVEKDKDCEDLFEHYVEELDKKVKLLLQNILEHAKALEAQKSNRVEYLEFLKSYDFIKAIGYGGGGCDVKLVNVSSGSIDTVVSIADGGGRGGDAGDSGGDGVRRMCRS